MQKYQRFLIPALIVLSLLFTAISAAADIYDKTTNINSSITGDVTGNKGLPDTATNLSTETAIVPIADSTDRIYNNHVAVNPLMTITVTGSVYGGATYGNGAVEYNDVNINKATITGNVYGGYNGDANSSGNIINNTVTINNGGTVNGNIYGGYSSGNGYVTLNEVTINSDGAVSGTVYGGYSSGSGKASDNIVNINGTVSLSVYGGYAYGNGYVSDNKLVISGMVSLSIYGGYARGSGTVTGNQIEISSTVNSVYGGYSEGTGSMSGNSVILSGAAVGRVVGGYVTSANDSAVSDNIVTIASGGMVTGNVYGGVSYGIGNVTDNIVEIYGTVTGDVYGGWSNSSSATTVLSGNSVTVSGTVVGKIYGGYSVFDGLVTNNSITIESSAILDGASLYGGKGSASGSNTLNVNGFSGEIWALANFSSYKFILGQLNSNLTVVTIIGGSNANIDNSDITITFAPGFYSSLLSVGDEITIIDGITANTLSVTVDQTSPFIVYDFTETHNTAKLLLTIDDVTLHPQTFIIAQSFAASLVFLGQAADLRIVPIGPLFVRRNLKVVPEGPRFTPFVTASYSRQYIATGAPALS